MGKNETDPQRNGHQVFNANELTPTDFILIGQTAGLDVDNYQSGNHPSPRLMRPGFKVICQENTVGSIRHGTIFTIGQGQEFRWDNPTVIVEEEKGRVVFKSSELNSRGRKIVVTPDCVRITYPRKRK